MIELNNITKRYGEFTAIEDISCSFGQSSIFGLVGYNGAGKTTLLKCVCGVFKPDAGEIRLGGRAVYDDPEVKSRVFFVPDDIYILPQASMKRMAKFYSGFYPNWNAKAFEKLSGIFKLDINKRMGGFSKGMQRQASIIFGLAAQPDFLLLDEAFDGIDPMMRDLVRQLLLEAIAERSMGIIISSHNLRELEDLCDHIGVINGKRIAYAASVDDMRVNKNKYKAVFSEEITGEAVKTALGNIYRNLKLEGRMVTFIADGPANDITEKIEVLKPLLVETLPLTLEEIFLIEMEAQSYDFSGIFE